MPNTDPLPEVPDALMAYLESLFQGLVPAPGTKDEVPEMYRRQGEFRVMSKLRQLKKLSEGHDGSYSESMTPRH